MALIGRWFVYHRRPGKIPRKSLGEIGTNGATARSSVDAAFLLKVLLLDLPVYSTRMIYIDILLSCRPSILLRRRSIFDFVDVGFRLQLAKKVSRSLESLSQILRSSP